MIRIRNVRESDLDRVNDLLCQVHAVHAEKRPDIFLPGRKKYTDEQLLAIFGDATTPVFVAVDDCDTVLGYAFCVLRETEADSSLTPRKTVYIDDLCVDAAARRQGIGKALYAYVCKEARSLGCDAVTLNVWCLNEGAMRFYQSLGMKPLKIVMEQKI